MKKAKLVIRRMSKSGQHGYLVLDQGAGYGWDVDPRNAHRFESMLPAVKAAASLDLDEGYDFVWMR